ncbi:hypothetical protein F5Y00DRAFT_257748 [Daldinia vernicosa]|uniref:uncharacterized protein n=1 Tax=Daldinia vernicosa TaxID=114800 RepID=UPI002007F5BF|nr:uncharacterized protein F5Y00DRAFT_257748 [Daldinia vernicosa]KAI0853096.1 hypothetical protein F5Y00DRAFT_257748 [Daldinia vernicosa]
MKSFGLFSIIVASALLPATQATWCQFFYDSGCSNSANGDTNFDCANHNVFGSGGGYAKCHGTKGSKQSCLIDRCSDGSCANSETFNVASDESCVGMGGAGPYYKIYFA